MRFLREYLIVFLFAVVATALPMLFFPDSSWGLWFALDWAFMLGLTCGVRR